MAYFNHAFTKVFLGTQVSGVSAGQNPNPNMTNGFITVAGIPTLSLGQTSAVAADNYGPGSYGFFDPKTNLSVDASFAAANSCCPVYLAGAALVTNDKIGPFHGGYKESNKSKIINPKYIRKFYRVDSCTPQQAVLSIGTTPYSIGLGTAIAITTAGAGLTDGTYAGLAVTGGTGAGMVATVVVAGNVVTSVTVTNPGFGYVTGDVVTVAVPGAGTDPTFTLTVTTPAGCDFEFLCGETYNLRIDLKGSPALRFLNHNAYQTLAAYTGCCAGPVPTAVDSTLVMIDWATQMITNNYLKNFIAPVVYDETGVAWYAPGTTVTLDGTNTPVLPSQWWDAYVSPGHTAGATAGIRIFGAYVDTKFGNCSFQLTDFYEKEPIKIYGSLVDLNGDPCTFEGICIFHECLGVQGMGFGETVVRDLILSESYLQYHFHTDIRMREIEQGDQILASVNRNALYTRYYILHSVPRFNNPTGVFDNDQYMLEIISTGVNAALESFMSTWLDTCAGCVSLEENSCTHCTIVAD